MGKGDVGGCQSRKENSRGGCAMCVMGVGGRAEGCRGRGEGSVGECNWGFCGGVIDTGNEGGGGAGFGRWHFDSRWGRGG